MRCRDVAQIKRTRRRHWLNKPGRPKGTRTTEDRIRDLRAFLIWVGRPDLSVSKIIELLRTHDAGLDPKGEELREKVIAGLRGFSPYALLKGRSLQRDIETVQYEIWGNVKPSERKAWGRSVRAGEPLEGGKDPKKTATEWEKAGAPSRATYYRRLHRRHRRGTT